jgi:hypothetical protein
LYELTSFHSVHEFFNGTILDEPFANIRILCKVYYVIDGKYPTHVPKIGIFLFEFFYLLERWPVVVVHLVLPPKKSLSQRRFFFEESHEVRHSRVFFVRRREHERKDTSLVVAGHVAHAARLLGGLKEGTVRGRGRVLRTRAIRAAAAAATARRRACCCCCCAVGAGEPVIMMLL